MKIITKTRTRRHEIGLNLTQQSTTIIVLLYYTRHFVVTISQIFFIVENFYGSGNYHAALTHLRTESDDYLEIGLAHT